MNRAKLQQENRFDYSLLVKIYYYRRLNWSDFMTSTLVFTARYAMVSRLSVCLFVCLSVTLVYSDSYT